MCATCGCVDGPGVLVTDPAHGHGHPGRTVSVEQDVLAVDDRLAAGNRAAFAER